VDGLQAEREQGITIDVAYRFFTTDERRFVVADTPGHEQYTCNMATGASTASLAVILIDARKGVLVQTRRHSRIVAMMGIKHVVLAVNKMDLVGFDEATLNTIVADYRSFASNLGFATLQVIPLSGLTGDNVLAPSPNMPWYSGPTLMQYLNTVDTCSTQPQGAFRMPVQWVNRPHLDFRGFCGRIAAGTLQPGDAVRVLPSGVQTQVKAVLLGFDEVGTADAGDAVTITLVDEVDASRGDVLVAADAPPEVADQFEAKLLWMSEHALAPGRQYLMKHACKEVTATITAIKYREDVNSGAHLAAKMLGLNEIAVVNLSTSAPLVFEPYAVNQTLGGFILIDKLTFETVGAGMIDFALRRASNIHWQALELNKATRAAQKHQTPRCIWFTGLSGSGKSTLANLLDKRLFAEGRHAYVLDGDNVRHGLNRNLGFTEADRVENIRRVAEVARLMVDAGLIVLVSFISPFAAERVMARSLFEPDEFVEVFVDVPFDECARRDVKGLYAKALRGELSNFTGLDSPYEAPSSPDVHLLAAQKTMDECVEQLLKALG
jgi:bifunctional enzyme CysN/CysC